MSDFELYEYSENKLKEAKKRIDELEDKLANADYQLEGRENEIKELKEELKKWKDEWQKQVQKATDEGYARTLQTMQLSKAKEIIHRLLVALKDHKWWNYHAIDEAEQFLRENSTYERIQKAKYNYTD